VGSRYNPKRGYIFVSKVLGKHWPVSPGTMGAVHSALAEGLGKLKFAKPAVLVAMAETAVGLGRGIFDRYAEAEGPDGLLFLQTTRHNPGRPAFLASDEPHSHARGHEVLFPEGDPEKARILAGARTLILVDDEITTGETLKGLAREFIAKAGSAAAGRAGGGVERVALASIASFLSPEAEAGMAGALAAVLSRVSLLEGTFSFEKTGEPLPPGGFRSRGAGPAAGGAVPRERGRLGLLPGEGKPDLRAAMDSLAFPAGDPVRVIGTGEFLHEPFLLASAYASEGRRVVFQSTTRTPIAPGGPVGSVWRFEDDFGEGLDNFLYNAPASFEGHTVVCRETASPPPGFDIAGRLGAREILL
jgi:hypothetical protein